MKSCIRYRGDGKFLAGLKELEPMLGFALAPRGKTVSAEKSETREISVRFHAGGADFTYYDSPSFFRAFSLALEGIMENRTDPISVKPKLKELGVMLNSSSQVLSVEGVKEFLRNQAVMGYTYVELYTETTYEIPSEPYFGYKKGRFTESELKEIVAYASLFGIEVVPCIQTLAHLSDLFRWGAFGEIFDIRDTLLVGHPKTYELIDKMLASVASCFSSKRINLGMDEAYFMGHGRYHWFSDDGYPDRSMLFLKHLKKVLSLAKKHGFTQPAIWFDNLFGIRYKGYIDPPVWLFKDFPEKIRKAFPKVRLIWWNYAVTDADEFERLVGYVRQLSPDISFASMAHGYTSFAPENRTAEKLIPAAVEGCRRCAIDDVLVTWWGTRIPHMLCLAAFYNFAEKFTESEGIDFGKRAAFLFGYTYEELRLLDEPNFVGAAEGPVKSAEGNNLPFYAIPNDALIGTYDRHIPDGAEEKFAILSEKFKELSLRDTRNARLFAFEAQLCKTLSVRAELGKKIKRAYDGKDYGALREIADSISTIAFSVKRLHLEYIKLFLTYAKSTGREKWDLAFGGSIARLYDVRKILRDYLSGRIDSIPELESERLPVNPKKDGQPINCGRDWFPAGIC